MMNPIGFGLVKPWLHVGQVVIRALSRRPAMLVLLTDFALGLRASALHVAVPDKKQYTKAPSSIVVHSWSQSWDSGTR